MLENTILNIIHCIAHLFFHLKKTIEPIFHLWDKTMEKIQLKEEWIAYAYTVSHYDIYTISPLTLGAWLRHPVLNLFASKQGNIKVRHAVGSSVFVTDQYIEEDFRNRPAIILSLLKPIYPLHCLCLHFKAIRIEQCLFDVSPYDMYREDTTLLTLL
jgi:hypothetical protein